MQQRDAITRENEGPQKALAEKGLVFNTVDPVGFKEKLRAAKFYESWREKFGEDLWSLLEEYTGKLV